VKRLLVVLTALCALAAPSLAEAHPLGNFTVNRFSRIEVHGDRVYVRYVLDLAEIPTFQAGRIDARAYAGRIAGGAHMTVAGRPARLTPGPTALTHPRGAGGLPTTRLEVVLVGPRLTGRRRVVYHDNNYANRIGWSEIVVGAGVPSRSDELRAYPRDLLSSPLSTRTVSAMLAPLAGPSSTPALSRRAALAAPDRVADDGFAALVGQQRLSALVVLGALGAALFWGAAHALSPGHGKTIVTAYLVGRRGSPWDAALLGAIVTATHTVGVFGLGFVTLALSQFIVPERLYPWLNVAAGVLVVGIGGSVLLSRWRHRRAHAHAHGHHHHHHDPEPGRGGLRSLVAVGVSGGLLPCPSALVVLLAAISLHRVAFGLLLILAFSAGLALAITGVGLVAVLAKRAFGRLSFEGRVIGLLPAASALVILLAGIAMTARAIPQLT
jgi:ABC-type nickel/cobalt efflux system permease component RcnA